MTANTGGTTIQGRVAAGGDARVQGITIGTNPPLTPNAYRVDLVVGRNLTVDGGGGSVPNGAVTYGGTLTPTGTLTALGGLHPGQPPFDFAAEATTLSERSAQWADLAPNGTIAGPSYDVRFTGTDPCATCSPSPPRSCRARGRSRSTSRPARRRSSTSRDRPSRARCTGSRWRGHAPDGAVELPPRHRGAADQRPGLAGNAARAARGGQRRQRQPLRPDPRRPRDDRQLRALPSPVRRMPAPRADQGPRAGVAVHRSGDQSPHHAPAQYRRQRARGHLEGPRQRADRGVLGEGRNGHVLRRARGRHGPPHRRHVRLHDPGAGDDDAALRRSDHRRASSSPVRAPRRRGRGGSGSMATTASPPRATWSMGRRRRSRSRAATRRGRCPSARSPAEFATRSPSPIRWAPSPRSTRAP